MADFEKFPAFNFFPRDWITGTAGLSPEQKSAFIDLLSYAWEQTPPCTLPDDDVMLARLAGFTVQKWKKVGPAIRAKLEPIEGGRLRNPKLWSVYLDMCDHREKRRRAGERGNNKRWGSPSDRNANGNASRNDSRKTVAKGIAKPSLPTPTPNDKDDANASSRMVDLAFARFWQAYPKRSGANPKRDALRAWNARIAEGVTPEEIMAGLERYVDFLKAKGDVGTEFVMQAKRFVGPACPFADAWDPPPARSTNGAAPQKFDYSNATTQFKGFTA